MMTTKDTARHLHQLVQDYQLSIGGTERIREWVLEERAQARLRWKEDASEVAWDKVMALARQTLDVMALGHRTQAQGHPGGQEQGSAALQGDVADGHV